MADRPFPIELIITIHPFGANNIGMIMILPKPDLPAF